MTGISTDETEVTIDRPGCKVHYWLSGDPAKPLIFFLHGACLDHSQFDMQMPALAGTYQIVRIDMRGQGLSRPLDGPFRVSDTLEDVVAIMDTLGRKDAIFIGQSTGTYAIQELVFRRPETVTAAIIIDGTCITAKLSPVESFLLRLSPLLLRLYPYGSLVKSMVNSSSVNDATKRYLERTFRSMSMREIINVMSGVSNCVHYEPGYHVRCPLLLVRGAHDRLGNIEKAMKEWSMRDRQSKCVVVPDAGHCSNQDNPEFFNAIMLEFLNGLAYRGNY